MIRTAEAVIDLSALSHNLSRVRHVVGSSRIMAVVKANAYGHGMLEIANALQNADAFAVGCVKEGVALREFGIQAPICVLQGYASIVELEQCDLYKLSPVIHQFWQIDTIKSYVSSSQIPVWIKITTGMNRLGFQAEDIQAVLQQIQVIKQVFVQGYMTHFAHADSKDDHNDVLSNPTRIQLEKFLDITKAYNGELSAANSAAILEYPQAHLDIVRPGLSLYGINPFAYERQNTYRLKPVMTLKSRLIAINRCKKGDPIGYGGEFVCPQDMLIGVVAIGYGDGYPRSIRQGTPVLVGEQTAPIVGRVSMDMITIDLSLIENVNIGDDIILWGSKLPVEKIAEAANTIAYELLCNVYGRVQFKYV